MWRFTFNWIKSRGINQVKKSHLKSHLTETDSNLGK
jgi:hypothetical protein